LQPTVLFLQDIDNQINDVKKTSINEKPAEHKEKKPAIAGSQPPPERPRNNQGFINFTTR